MAIRRDGLVIRQLRTLFNAGTTGDLTDGQLLERFATRDGEAAELAFAALVERHGPMVLRVCRSVLHDGDGTEDAFQATFLVLVRRARSLWVRDSLGPWLHQVAYRTASCARTAIARRRRHERRAAEMVTGQADFVAGFDDEGEQVLHQEIDRLPDRFRVPVVLCDLEGRTHEQAARHLSWPVGTVKSRLARGRDRLRDRLTRRGLAPAAMPPAGSAAATVPHSVAALTVRTAMRLAAANMAAGVVAGSVVSLMEGALKQMTQAKMRLLAAPSLVTGVAVAAGLGFMTMPGIENPPAATTASAQAQRPAIAVGKSAPPAMKVEETLSDLAHIFSNGEVKVEGVGLVYGLEDTGVDPPPGYYRQKFVEEMRKAGVENANQVLKDKRFALVIVRAKIPTGVAPTDRLDVDLELPPASGTTSLAGGYLLQTRLREVLVAYGTPKEGIDLALAQGPVLIGSAAEPDNPKVGRVLGAARVKKATPFTLVINDGRRSVRTSATLQGVINRRFHFADGVDEAGAATAKTDQFLELKVPRVYRHNQDRYFRVVKLLPVIDSPELRARRQEIWGHELLDPKTAGVAALRLEGMGVSANETLKQGLASPNARVRFFAAEAMAYLDDPVGVDILADTTTKQPEFRTHALAALGALDQAAAHLALRKLMDVDDDEVRYGAFNALRTFDENDPFHGRVRVLNDPAGLEEGPQDNSMLPGMAIEKRRNRVEDPFALYLVDCDGPPITHVANTRRCEVVLFGRDQKLRTPLALGTGSILIHASEGDPTVQISKIVASRPAKFDDDARVTASLALEDVIRQVANLGAKYPDIVALLRAAERQKNLPGPLVVGAVPGNNPVDPDAVFRKDTTVKEK